MRRGVGWSSDWSKISAVGRGGARFPPRWVELGSSGVRGAAGFDLSHGLLLPSLALAPSLLQPLLGCRTTRGWPWGPRSLAP